MHQNEKLESLEKENMLELAKTTSNISILTMLANSEYSIVRRAIARNKYTPLNILEVLINDPVINVSYMARKNMDCLNQQFCCNINHPCIFCEEDERRLPCSNCAKFHDYFYKSIYFTKDL